MTAQEHEELTIDYKVMEHGMACEVPIPEDRPRIVCLNKWRDDYNKNKELYVAPHFMLDNPTSCWRGYNGSWEIKDGYPYLVGLCGDFMLIGKPILADWFTGELKVPLGELVFCAYGV